MTNAESDNVTDRLFLKVFNLRKGVNEACVAYGSPKLMGVNKGVVLGNVVVCVSLSIVIGIFIGISLLVVIHLLVLCLSFKTPDFLCVNSASITSAPPMMNRWYLG